MLYLRTFNRFILISLALLSLSGAAQGAIFTYGNLATDDATDIIEDTVTGRQYLRFDTFNLTYADTVAAVATGGIYESWSIANSTISDEFIEGLFGGATPCSGAASYGADCGLLSGWADGVFGDSYTDNTDFYAFESTLKTPVHRGQEIGVVRLEFGSVTDYDDWSSVASLDNHGGVDIYPINLLLYKEVNPSAPSPVPVPAAIWLFGTALIGLVRFNRRRKSA